MSEETTTVTSPTAGGSASAGASGNNKVKFLCSHGGKISLRPPDGHLKYVGGETRVIAVHRHITFQELMKKLSSMSDGKVVLKYQVLPEDLGTLISVTCDDDLQNMIAEYDRQCKRSSMSENNGCPMLRSFLFPSKPVNVDKQHLNIETMDTHELEQHYIDAINGVLRSRITFKHNRTGRKVSSAGSSPRSLQNDGHLFDHINHDGFVSNSSHFRSKDIPRVNSSPSLYNLGQHNYYHPSPSPAPAPAPAHQQHPYHSSTGIHIPCNNGSGQQLGPVILAGRGDFQRYQMGYPNRPPRYIPQAMSNSTQGSCGHGDNRIYRSGGLEMVIPSGSVGP